MSESSGEEREGEINFSAKMRKKADMVKLEPLIREIKIAAGDGKYVCEMEVSRYDIDLYARWARDQGFKVEYRRLIEYSADCLWLTVSWFE
jgi:hypothetical protein